MISVKNEDTKLMKKVLKKYSNVKVPDQEKFQGKVKIKNVRFYKYLNPEVDVVIDGKFWARYGHTNQWIDSSYKPKISKIKSNRLLRKLIFPFVRTHLNYFGEDIKGYWQIKKVEWV